MGAAKDLFLDALEVEPAGRGAFLDARCGGDGGLREEVRRLIDAHTRADRWLGSTESAAPVPGVAVEAAELLSEDARDPRGAQDG